MHSGETDQRPNKPNKMKPLSLHLFAATKSTYLRVAVGRVPSERTRDGRCRA